MNTYQSTPDFYRDYIQHFNPFHNPKNGQFASGHDGARTSILPEKKQETKKELNDKAIAEKWNELDDKTRREYLEQKVKNIKHPPLTDKPVMTIKTTDGRTWKSESEKSLYGWMNKDQIKQRDEQRIGWEMEGLSKDAIKYCETQFGGTMANVDDPELIELVVMEYEDATGKKGFKKNIDFTKI